MLITTNVNKILFYQTFPAFFSWKKKKENALLSLIDHSNYTSHDPTVLRKVPWVTQKYQFAALIWCPFNRRYVLLLLRAGLFQVNVFMASADNHTGRKNNLNGKPGGYENILLPTSNVIVHTSA